jgi:hypothetical protein
MCVYNPLTNKNEYTGFYQGIIRQEIDGYVAYLPDLETLISVGEFGNAKLVLNGIREETFDLNAKVIEVNKDKTDVEEFNAIDIPSHPGQYINVDLNWVHGIEITAGNTHGNKITFNSDYTLTRDEFIKETAPINGNAGNNKVTAATAIVAGLSVAGALGVGYTLFAGRREEPEAEKQAMKKSDGGNASIGMLSISDAPKKPKEPSIAEETRDEVREREWTELKERRRKERLEEAEGKLPDVPEEPKRNASDGMWGNSDEPKTSKRKAPAVTGMWGQSYDEEFNNLSRDEIRERELKERAERMRRERLD